MSLEVTLILPTLMLLLVMAYAGFDVFKVHSQSAKIGYAINDIVSRYETVSDTEIDELYALQQKMFPPYMTDVKMRISSICFEDDTYQVMWSDVNELFPIEFDAEGNPIEPSPGVVAEWEANAVPPLRNDTIPFSIMPTMAPQTSVILTEISATYNPIFGFFPPQDLTTELVIRPRLVNIMPHADLNAGLVCPDVNEVESTPGETVLAGVDP